MWNVETKLKVTDFLQCSLRLLYYITAKGCGQTSRAKYRGILDFEKHLYYSHESGAELKLHAESALVCSSRDARSLPVVGPIIQRFMHSDHCSGLKGISVQSP